MYASQIWHKNFASDPLNRYLYKLNYYVYIFLLFIYLYTHIYIYIYIYIFIEINHLLIIRDAGRFLQHKLLKYGSSKPVQEMLDDVAGKTLHPEYYLNYIIHS